MAPMEDLAIQRERVHNLWNSFARKFPPVDHATWVDPVPEFDFDQIGGLAPAKEELLTYACAATNPEVYSHWGTLPPSALLLIGRRGAGKHLLAHALATRTGTSFLRVSVPRLVLEVLQAGGKLGELLGDWRQSLAELPTTTVFFDELEFSQAQDIGTHRTDLPIGPIMEFLLELVDRTIDVEGSLVVGASAYPQTLRPAFLAPNRFERVVEVNPIFPDDIVEALAIHAAKAEKRAGRRLFEAVDWTHVVSRYRQPSTGDWVRIMHAALRRKARCEAAGEEVTPVGTEDLLEEVERVRRADTRLLPAGGTYI
jgi:ATP-dependent 26S proteasome regulatory subunit